MNKKVKFLKIGSSLAITAIGVLYLLSQISFYNEGEKATAVITAINTPQDCVGTRGCYLTRNVTFSFRDRQNRVTNETQEVWTHTLVSGVISAGSKVAVLYKPQTNTHTLLDSLIPNIGTPAYKVRMYTWHYWGYPVIVILLGPLSYLMWKRMQKGKTSYSSQIS